LLEAVHESCAWVAQGAKQVRVCLDALESAVLDLEPEMVRLQAEEEEAYSAQQSPPDWLRSKGEAEQVNYVVTCALLNFGSGFRRELLATLGRSTSENLVWGLERLARARELSAAGLAALSEEEVAAFWSLESGGAALRALARLFHETLQEAARELEALRAHDFSTALEEALRAPGAQAAPTRVLLRFLARSFAGFRDQGTWRGRRVWLLKKAQLCLAELVRRVPASVPGRALRQDPALARELSLFADNVVVVSLRQLGLLRLEPALAARIEAGEELEAGSEVELELRACSVVAGDALLRALAARRSGLGMPALDRLLWLRGRRPDPALPKPHFAKYSRYY
jgi:hypothetical protein